LHTATHYPHIHSLPTRRSSDLTGELYNKENIGSVVSMSAPNITDDTLFVGGSSPNPYTFSAYDLTNDTFKWQNEFPDVYSGLDDVPPAVSDNIVVTTALEKAED